MASNSLALGQCGIAIASGANLIIISDTTAIAHKVFLGSPYTLYCSSAQNYIARACTSSKLDYAFLSRSEEKLFMRSFW